jgi:glycosyltransferase involved in cell wall biosynthesis
VNKPFRILYISPNAFLGGAERAVEIYLRYHNREKYTPLILFLRDGPLVEEFQRLGLKVYVAPKVKIREVWKYPALLKFIVNIIKVEKIDLVHSVMGYGHFFGGHAAFWSKTPCVWYQHGPISSFDTLVSLIPAKGILVNSRYTQNEQQKLNFRKFLIHIIDPPIESQWGKINVVESRNRFRNKIGILPEDVLVGSVGRIQEWKGQLYFLKAFHEASMRKNNLKAVIVGSADIGSKEYENQIKDYITQHHLEKKVFVTGFINNLDSAYFAMDIFVHSSTLPEPFGLVITEAMIKKVAVIAAPFGGPLETIIDGKTGFFADPTDTSTLASKILSLADNSHVRNEIADNAYQFAQKFLAPQVLAKLERTYDGILMPLVIKR